MFVRFIFMQLVRNRSLRIAGMALAAVLTAACFAEAGQKPERASVDQSVERALAFLQLSQAPDGAWRTHNIKDAAITGLAVMAFLSAGHVPGEGPYGDTVEKGLRWVLDAQQPNGMMGSAGHHPMYHQGICTLMLAEVAGMTSAKVGSEVREKLQKAVQVILLAQRARGNEGGGWRYEVRGFDSDLSVSGWQIMALRAAKDLGCDVPQENIERAIGFIQRCRDPITGGFRYRPGNRVTAACTGTGILALEVCSKEFHGSPELQQAGSLILKNAPWNSEHDSYAVYYCTQAMYQLGDNYWNVYRPQLHEALLNRQRRNGSWDGEAGPDYGTAMAILALTVDYGFLPIYQRGTDAAAKTDK